jgi:serine/threonine protein kinase
MSETPRAPLPADTFVGGYRIVSELWDGGFGIVYVALDSSGNKVALKEYLPIGLTARAPGTLVPQVLPGRAETYSQGVKDFLEIGRYALQFSHPAVVGVSAVFEENQNAYLVMEYLHGETLQNFIVTARTRKRPEVFQETTIRSLFADALLGLQRLHERGVIHLDLKPSNFFITNDNRIVLLDFGAARVGGHNGAGLPVLSHVVYTPGFAAPEVYRRGATLGAWTDIYAAGACLFSCMRGYPPRDVPQRLKDDHLERSLARLGAVYSAPLVDAVRRCMALDAAARPQSVSALRAMLEQ